MSAAHMRQSRRRHASTTRQKASATTALHHTAMFPIEVTAWTHWSEPQPAPVISSVPRQ